MIVGDPMRVKLFLAKMGYFSSSRRFAERLEREINGWLEEHYQIKIVEGCQSSSGGSFEPISITISVWYEEQEQPSAAATHLPVSITRSPRKPPCPLPGVLGTQPQRA